MRALLSIVGKSLAWALGISFVVFVAMFLTPLLIGGPGSHQAPLGAFVVGPLIFVVALFGALLCQIRRGLMLPRWSRALYAVILLLLLMPAVRGASVIAPAASWFSELKIPDRAERMEFSPPLTETERQLLRATRFDLTVAVTKGRVPPVYATSLIRDLTDTGLFEHVGLAEETPTAQLQATVAGSYYGDKQGARFYLSFVGHSKKTETVNVWYWIGGTFRGSGDRQQYLDRLAVDVIRAVNRLQPNGR